MAEAEQDPAAADIERRLRDGKWLSTAELAVLFGRDRTTVYRWAKRGLMGYRVSPGGGEYEIDPTDAVRELEKYRQVRRDGAAADLTDE